MLRIKASIRGLSLLLLLLLTVSSSQKIQAKSTAADSVIYADAMVDPWVEGGYSYGTDFQLDSNTAYLSTKGIAVTHTDANGAFKVYTPTPLSSAEYTSISFWVYGAAGGSPINFFLGDTAVESYQFTAPAGVWTQYTVPLDDLGSPATFDLVNWQDSTGAAQPTYYLDEIVVKAKTATVGFPDATADSSRRLDPKPGPSGVAIAPNGRVYVAVYKDDQVYSWATVADMLGGNLPDKTFGSDNGDPDVAGSCALAVSATMMCGPESVAVDSGGNLFVADTYNHRVLIFKNPDTDQTPLVADADLGQAHLSNNDPDYQGVANDGILDGFCYVRGVAVDANDNVWVVDEFNYRVVRFNTPLTTDTVADKVFGQADLDNEAAGCVETPSGNSGANQFSLPLGVAVDQQGVVYVADHSNNRVQRFAATAVTGADAAASYMGLNEPHDVAVDKQGNLYIADTLNSQVLVFKDGASGDLTSDHKFPTRNFPMGMAFSATGDFLLADCGSPAPASTYPPCINGARGIYFFAAPVQQFLPPNAVDDTANTLMNTAVSGNVLTNDSDPQSSPIAVVNSVQPSFGSVTVAADGSFTYTPQNNFVGQDSFFYTIGNSYNYTATARAIMVVTEVGQPTPPNAVADSATTRKNTSVNGNLLTNDSDPQSSPFTVSDFTQPTQGEVTVADNGDYTYTPPTDFLGQATFTYTIRNTLNLTDSATVAITVNEVGATLDESLFMPSLER